MEFTKEQEEHIQKLISEATEGLFTQDELDKKVTSEVDRRVESGIQKGLETNKSKWKEEYERKAQLSAEELAKLTVEEKVKAIEEREAEINKRSNRLDARERFSSADIPEEDYINFMDLLISDDVDTTNTNVGNFIESLTKTRDNIEKSVKEKLSKVPAPQGEETPRSNKSNINDFLTIANEANIRDK